MEFGIGFILLLLVVGGFAAYQGDRVGMFVGRRRLSIFGLRPRYTSRIITIFTGVLIVLFTLTSLILLSSSVRQALFGMEQLRGSVTALSMDVSRKNAELNTLETQRKKLNLAINDLTGKNLQLHTQNSQLHTQNDKLQTQYDKLNTQNTKLRKDTDSLTKRNNSLLQEQKRLESDRELLAGQLTELRKAGDYYFDQANRMQKVNADLRQASFLYHALDVISSRVVDTRQTVPQLRKELLAFVAEANKKVLNQRTSGETSNAGLRLDRIITLQDNSQTEISTDTVIDLVVDAIRSDPKVQSVIVQLVALTNAARGETVLGDFFLIQNVRLYTMGEEVGRHVFDGNLPASQLFEDAIVWMQGEIHSIAREKGLLPQSDGAIGGVTPKQLYALTEQIAAQSDAVEVIAYAANECWTYGPLTLGFKLRKRSDT